MMETMGRKKARRGRSFTKECKAEVVALVRQPGNSAASVARDLESPPNLSHLGRPFEVYPAASLGGSS